MHWSLRAPYTGVWSEQFHCHAIYVSTYTYKLFCPLERLCTPSFSSMYVPPFEFRSVLSGVLAPGRCDLFPETSRDLVLELVADVKAVVARCAARFPSGRRAGSAAPMSATLGSTCDGIQNVVPYTSNCGGTRVLISYCSPGNMLFGVHPLELTEASLHLGSIFVYRAI
jgi:hypothetical protein